MPQLIPEIQVFCSVYRFVIFLVSKDLHHQKINRILMLFIFNCSLLGINIGIQTCAVFSLGARKVKKLRIWRKCSVFFFAANTRISFFFSGDQIFFSPYQL